MKSSVRLRSFVAVELRLIDIMVGHRALSRIAARRWFDLVVLG